MNIFILSFLQFTSNEQGGSWLTPGFAGQGEHLTATISFRAKYCIVMSKIFVCEIPMRIRSIRDHSKIT